MENQVSKQKSNIVMINQTPKSSAFLKKAFVQLGKQLPSIVIYGYAFLFMYTGIDKVQNIEQFSLGLRGFPYLGQFAELIAWTIPCLEILLATILILPFAKIQRWALVAATGLMGIFCLYVGAVVFFIEKAPCSCGGVIKSMDWTTHLIFNLVWLAAGIFSYRRISKK